MNWRNWATRGNLLLVAIAILICAFVLVGCSSDDEGFGDDSSSTESVQQDYPEYGSVEAFKADFDSGTAVRNAAIAECNKLGGQSVLVGDTFYFDRCITGGSGVSAETYMPPEEP